MEAENTIIRVDIDKLMKDKIKEIQKERELYPHETIIPPDVIPDGFCQCCGFKLNTNEIGFCRICETRIYGKS